MQDCSLNVVAKHTNLTWDQVDGIQSRAVERGLKIKKKNQLTEIGIDEVAYKKGHNYFTIVHDKVTGNVLHVVDGRKTKDIDTFYNDWKGYTDGITSVSMDLWKAFVKSTRKHLSNADDKICFDRFHVAGFFSKAVDLVRRKEHSQLLKLGDNTLSKSLRKHLFGIMNSILLGINNGRAESINSKIQKIKKMSCGFRNVDRFKKSILFHLGGLQLYPI